MVYDTGKGGVEWVQSQQQSRHQPHAPVTKQSPHQPVYHGHPQTGQHHRRQAHRRNETWIEGVSLDRYNVLKKGAGSLIDHIAQQDTKTASPHRGDAGVPGTQRTSQPYCLLEASVIGW